MTIENPWRTYTDQQLADVIDGFDKNLIKLVVVADHTAVSIEATNWLQHVEEALTAALREELARRKNAA